MLEQRQLQGQPSRDESVAELTTPHVATPINSHSDEMLIATISDKLDHDQHSSFNDIV